MSLSANIPYDLYIIFTNPNLIVNNAGIRRQKTTAAAGTRTLDFVKCYLLTACKPYIILSRQWFIWILSWRYSTVETEGKLKNVSIRISGNVLGHYSMCMVWNFPCPLHGIIGEYGGIAPLFLNFGSSWRRIVNLAPRFTSVKEPRYTLNRRLVDPRIDMDDFGVRKNICPFRYPDPGPSNPWSGHYTDYSIAIPSKDTLWLWVIGVYGVRLENSDRPLLSIVVSVRIKHLRSQRTNFYG